MAAGSAVSLFGNQLATETSVAASVPLPLNLSSSSVQVNGIPAPLFFVSPNQINFQIPWEAAGQIQVAVVAGGTTSASQLFAVSSASPGLFTINSAGQARS